MKINVYPADMGRCGHRLIWPAEALAAQGADVDVITMERPDEDQVQAQWGEFFDGTHRVVDVLAPDADVVVLQRPLRKGLVDSIPVLQAKGTKVVVEVDDDFTHMSQRNASWRDCHPVATYTRHKLPDGTTKVITHGGPDRNWQHLARACRDADLVTVSTPALAKRYGAHGRVRVVPNHIPASYLLIEREPHDGVYVGWTGSVETHPDDLQVCGAGVARAVRSTGATFAVIGTGKGVQRNLGLDEQPMVCGWVPLDEYPKAVAQLDVGIVPLELTAFNEAKSALKGLEYAALGVPFVASPTGPYLFDLAVGWHARKPKDWERMVRILIESAEGRAELRGRGREWAATQTVEGNCGQWLEAWQSVGQHALV